MGDINSPKTIGAHLKKLREQAKESMIEVSQAVEIDVELLKDIEAGNKTPEEDILSLLMSHFGVTEDDASKLWEIAGYTKANSFNPEEQLIKQIMMVIPMDNRVAFTDRFQIEANKNGIVINFLLGDSKQTVSKVGMSADTAKQLVLQLVHHINQASSVKSIKPLLDMPNSKPKKTN